MLTDADIQSHAARIRDDGYTVIERAGALRREGADFVIALVHCDKGTGLRLFASRAVDLILMGHTHDLHIDYDGRSALVESSQDALFVVVVHLNFKDIGTCGCHMVHDRIGEAAIIGTHSCENDLHAMARET